MSRLKIVLAAEESAGRQVLEQVARTDHAPVAVLTSDNDGTIAKLARRLEIEVLPAEAVKDPAFARWLTDHGVDVVLNVHSLYIIRPEVLEAPRLGAFNLHPGPLPEYSGLNCVSWAILEGATQYGVTLHEMVPAIDAGDIVAERRFPIEPDDTPFTLATRCIREGVPLVVELIEQLADDPSTVPRTVQDRSRRRYYDRSVPQEGRIDWTRPASEVVRYVRAFDYFRFPSPWGRPTLEADQQQYEVQGAHLTGEASTEPPGTLRSGGDLEDVVAVATADEWVHITPTTQARDAVLGLARDGLVLDLPHSS